MSATHVHCSSIVIVSWPAGAIVSAIELDSDAAHSANVKGAAQTTSTICCFKEATKEAWLKEIRINVGANNINVLRLMI